MYSVIYDGHCNLCVNLVRSLEALDGGQRFQYIPMQDRVALARYGLTPVDGQAGMIVINQSDPSQRWQGSDAAEVIVQLLPLAAGLVKGYQLSWLKPLGDQFYAYVRDHRYALFGQRQILYRSTYPVCGDGQCRP
ncbi:MAG: thiol-disulfide oxidoreductase DCC family protein [Nodosilinea sp.]